MYDDLTWALVIGAASVDSINSCASAQALTGQPDFHAKGDNRWKPVVQDSVCWPYGIQVCGKTAVLADSGNNRIQLWEIAV